jgi:rare lipoprotein A (peptidoglycan hydrolase)
VPILLVLLAATPLAVACGASTSSGGVPPLRLGARATATSPGPTAQTSPRSPASVEQPASTADPSRQRSIPPAHPIPPAFQPAPGALSDAQVRHALARLTATERRERERQLSPVAANLAALLPWSLEEKHGVSVASVFRDYGLGLACGGVLGRNQLGVAHKTAPCGTLITFTYAGRSLTVPVIDRGPYVAGREWDLTGATAEALGFPGLGEIEWRVGG